MLPSLPALTPPQIEPISIIRPAEEKKPEPKLYKIVENDNLSKIAEAHQTSVERLWAANTSLADPNLIEPNQELIIPLNTDVLPAREMPAMISVEASRVGTAVTGGSSIPKTRDNSSGNLYAVGFCTHYAKQRRPDIPNNLGNADTWYIRYKGNKGTTPQVGAVAVARGYMHVAFVEQVDGARVFVSEQNYQGYGIVSSRWSEASEWNYIY